MTNSSGFFRCLAICTVALFHAPPLIANDNNDGELLTERAFQSTVSRKVITPAFSLDSAKIAFALVPKDVLASDDSVIDVFNIHEFRCAERIVVTGSFLTEMAFVGTQIFYVLHWRTTYVFYRLHYARLQKLRNCMVRKCVYLRGTVA